jgi:D-alanyl-D-alanine carboxypeptidase
VLIAGAYAMSLLSPSRHLAVVGLLALSVAGLNWDHAKARGSRHHGKVHAKEHAKHHVVHGPNYHPPYAAIVVDANSDQVLHEASADEPRHPASLTKIMTLYLLFEQIEAGKFKLDTPLQVSTHASLQTPTKLGLKANQTLSVEDAIKGMCTKSANDAAVVVSEAVGGSEDEFARLMTEKARALGMTNTTYVNASGLPAEEQMTTARDQAILGRAIQDRFPGFYRYFSTSNFRYHGHDMHNHNSLLGQVKGVDGIKTGYTEASGYNLVSSVRRDQRHIVAVVLGGTSNAARDTRMRQLIEQHIVKASAQRTAPPVMEAARPDNVQGNVPSEKAAGPVTPAANPAPGPSAPAPSVVAPSESIEPTLASEKSDPAEAAKPQPQPSQPEVQPEKQHAQVAKATATVKLPSVHLRRSGSRATASRGSAVAHDSKTSW